MRKVNWSLLSSSLLFFFLFGCGSLLKVEPSKHTYYALPSSTSSEFSNNQSGNHQTKGINLLVKDVRSSGFLNSRKIVFIKNPLEQGFYQNASWVEPVPKRLTTMIIERLSASGIYKSVTRATNSNVADILLTAEILDFYHLIDSNPGLVKVRLEVELIDLKTNSLLTKKIFTDERPANSYDAEGAVKAMAEATQKIVDELVIWLAEYGSS